MSTNDSEPSTSTKVTKRKGIHPVVEIVNGYKYYGLRKKWHTVLRNVNMTVYSGEIYVLLGPHGCGKSTILNIILGINGLSQGFVKVFGFDPGTKFSGVPGMRVGYTPQLHGLHPEFTIDETYKYFGRLLGLKAAYIHERMSYLSDLLVLPSGGRFIKNCTESEKRQVSFGVAILHEPELLILDEPCHGVDPLLRKTIWDHLKIFVTKEDRTILLTTQNLPEANMADNLGIMRGGYLLMEGNPGDLLRTYKEKSIETLYMHIYSLKIHKNMDEKKSVEENPFIKVEKLLMGGSEGFLYTGDDDKVTPAPSKQKKTNCSCMRRFQQILPNFNRLGMLLMRDILRSFRNYLWLISLLLLPVFLIIVFSYTVGQTPSNLKVAIVNFEASPKDCRTSMDEYISCQILNMIDTDTLKLMPYDTYEDAEKDAFKMKVSAILIVGEKFTNQITRTMANIALDNVNIGNPDTAQLILRLDMTSRIVANAIENAVKNAVEDYLKMATAGTKVQNATIGYPMKVATPLFGQPRSSDSEFISIGLSITLLYHLAAFAASVTLVSDRILNLAARDFVAGVHLIESVISQLMVYGIILFLEAALMLIALIGIRQIPIKGSQPYLILVVFVQIWCGLCFGFLLANVSKNSVQASYVVFCFFSSTLILCGVLWPLNGQPEWLLTVVKFLPQTQAICSARCIIQRGVTVYNEEVYLGIIIPFIWLLLFILISIIINKVTY